METVTVSVLMPAFNAERYLRAAMDSVLAQTLADFELLVIDDGSTDSTPKILREYATRDKRVRVLHRPNKGVTASLNELVAMAKGRFIARMDADDIALPHRLERQVAFMERQPAVVCVGGAVELIDKDDRYLTTLKCPLSDAEIQQMILAGHTAICHPCAMMRSTALSQLGGYDASLETAEDLDLWLRLGEIGKLANLEEPVLRYRLHSESVSERKAVKQRDAMRTACERAWRRRNLQGHFAAADPWRPGKDSKSRHQFMLQYGWWAYLSRERSTAALYAMRAVKALPFAIGGWKLLVCALFKPYKARAR